MAKGAPSSEFFSPFSKCKSFEKRLSTIASRRGNREQATADRGETAPAREEREIARERSQRGKSLALISLSLSPSLSLAGVEGQALCVPATSCSRASFSFPGWNVLSTRLSSKQRKARKQPERDSGATAMRELPASPIAAAELFLSSTMVDAHCRPGAAHALPLAESRQPLEALLRSASMTRKPRRWRAAAAGDRGRKVVFDRAAAVAAVACSRRRR